MEISVSDWLKIVGFIVGGLSAFFLLRAQVLQVVARFESHAERMEAQVGDIRSGFREEMGEVKLSLKEIAASLHSVILKNGIVEQKVATHDRQIQRLEDAARGEKDR